MNKKNPLRKTAEKVLKLPTKLSMAVLTFIFRTKVKFVGTAGLKILKTDLKSVTFFQKNRKKVQNHIGGVHAAAMALLAESATGFVVGVNLPAGKLPLIKSMNLKYVRRSEGSLTAIARLTNEQIRRLEEEEKGDLIVEVTVFDESKEEPIICEMNWAWITKN